jgi:4-hydroxy-tetrahydrodipicolinate reductase
MTIRIAIHGAAGRMGKRLIALASADKELEIVAALDASGHPRLGGDAGAQAGVEKIGVLLTEQLDAKALLDVLVDFSTPHGAAHAVEMASARQIPLVMATTGLAPDVQQGLRQLSEKVAVVWAPSMSLAVNLTMQLAENAAQALKSYAGGVDVEIIERHHRFKEDAPSGTALLFGKLIADAMDLKRHVHGREGQTGQRSRDEIAYHAVRIGDNPGEHTIVFGMLGETIELTVRASSRDCYALGALQAAKFAARQKPGLYNMRHVLGLKTED